MQSNLNLPASHGLPLCLSGISPPPLSLSMEIADHDRRRKAMKRRKSETMATEHADQEIGGQRIEERFVRVIRDGEIDEDLADFVHRLYEIHFNCTAKAA